MKPEFVVRLCDEYSFRSHLVVFTQYPSLWAIITNIFPHKLIQVHLI